MARNLEENYGKNDHYVKYSVKRNECKGQSHGRRHDDDYGDKRQTEHYAKEVNVF